METNYKGLDDKILEAIRTGSARTFDGLMTHCKWAIESKTPQGKDEFRTLDMRLQALRKKRLIQFDRKSRTWSICAQ
jgi:hypothetical protein